MCVFFFILCNRNTSGPKMVFILNKNLTDNILLKINKPANSVNVFSIIVTRPSLICAITDFLTFFKYINLMFSRCFYTYYLLQRYIFLFQKVVEINGNIKILDSSYFCAF